MNELKKTESSEIAIYSKEEFLVKFAPMNMVTDCRHVKTMELAISEDNKGLSFHSKHVGELTVIAIIEAHVISLNKSINVKMPLEPTQVKEIAIEIQGMFYFLSMVEIHFIFRKAKRGGYGKVYNALSMEVILDWFTQYSEARTKHFMDIQNTKHTEHQEGSRRSGFRRDQELRGEGVDNYIYENEEKKPKTKVKTWSKEPYRNMDNEEKN